MKQSPVIRLTRQFRFEAAHALWNYQGHCRNIHGHSYVLFVTIKGKPCNDPAEPNCGMVMDFSVLKKLVHEQVVEPFDHAFMVNQNSPYLDLLLQGEPFGKVTALPYQPTCENMVHDFAMRLQKVLPKEVELFSLKLYETSTSYAEWHAGDNLVP